MRVCIQRVRSASVTLPLEEGRMVSEIGIGFLVLLGIGMSDSEKEAILLARKCSELRIFEDEQGKMNRAITDVGGSMLVVSQFTLYGDCRHGRRPSFTKAALPESANRLYLLFIDEIRKRGIHVETGSFQTEMNVNLINDGPVTLWMDTDEWS